MTPSSYDLFPSVTLALCALKGLRTCNCLLSLAPSLKGIKILWYRSFRTTTLFGQAFCQTLYQLLVSPMNRNIVKGSDGSITSIREEKYDCPSSLRNIFLEFRSLVEATTQSRMQYPLKYNNKMSQIEHIFPYCINSKMQIEYHLRIHWNKYYYIIDGMYRYTYSD